LSNHDLNTRSYRTKFGIPETQPLAARETTAKRRRITAEVKPWEKTPNYKKGQEKRAVTAQKAGRKKGTRKR
jgi:predicted transcriptional regulator